MSPLPGHRRPQTTLRVVTLLTAALVLPTLFTGVVHVEADSLTNAGPSLPTGRWDTAAATDGTYAYVFGGWDGTYLKEIVRFDPVTRTVTVLPVTLPTGMQYTAAVYHSGVFYLFGGRNAGAAINTVVKFDPATNSVTQMAAKMPTARFNVGAVATASGIYLFGGDQGGYAMTRDVLRYDPATDSMVKLAVNLPTARAAARAFWDGNDAYVLGGATSSSTNTNEILRFNPATMNLSVAARFYSPRTAVGVAFDGTHAYAFGGHTDMGKLDEIVRFTPATYGVSLMPGILPSARSVTSAVFLSGHAYIFGGLDSSNRAATPTILDYVPYGLLPTAPRNLVASPGNAVGEIALKWDAPAWDGGTPLTGYRVYRAAPGEGFTAIATVTSGATYTDTGIPNGATRYYKVSALNPTGEGTVSDTVSGKPPGVPGVPRNVAANPGSSPGQIAVTWLAPVATSGIPLTSYRVYRASDGGAFAPVADTLSTSYRDTGIAVGVTMSYKVSAINEMGEGLLSDLAAGTPPSLPGIPASLVASPGSSSGQVALNWAAPASNGGLPITGYRVYRAPVGGDFTYLASTATPAYRDAGIPVGETMYYRVTAVNGVGEGSASEPVAGTPPAPPSAPRDLKASAGTSGVNAAVNLQWVAPATSNAPITMYSIYRATTSDSFVLQAVVNGLLQTYTDRSCPLVTACTYMVSASTAGGEGPRSQGASVVGPPLV